jgi:membrane protein DedA with SNARE-associated domain
MDFGVIKDVVVGFVREHQAYAPLILGLMTFGESLAFISLLLPATTLIVTVGVVLSASGAPFWPAWLGAVIGAIAGYWLSYEFGLRFQTAAYDIWPLSRRPELIKKGERFFNRFGPLAVLLARFFGPVRAVVPMMGGIFKMPRLVFQSANVGSALVWAFLLLAPGVGLGAYLNW